MAGDGTAAIIGQTYPDLAELIVPLSFGLLNAVNLQDKILELIAKQA
jgi:hypothetical protein